MELGPGHPLYLHCWDYDVVQFCRWLQRFPQVILGLSPIILEANQQRHSGLHDTIRALEPGHYVLESDGPYLQPAPSKPYIARSELDVILGGAEAVAAIQGQSTEEVLQGAAAAARKFYGDPPHGKPQ